jgi:tetratricopeptide (TPR) repeat protein
LSRLVESNPDEVEYQNKFATLYANIGASLTQIGRQQDSVSAFQKAISYQKRAFTKAPQFREYRRSLSILQFDLAKMQRFLKHPSEAAAATLDRQKLWPNNPGELYNAACELAQCVPLVGPEKGELTREQQAEQRRYSDLAMEALRQSVKAGFKDAAHASKDPDLDPLRSRQDFGTLLMDMAFPADPFTQSHEA